MTIKRILVFGGMESPKEITVLYQKVKEDFPNDDLLFSTNTNTAVDKITREGGNVEYQHYSEMVSILENKGADILVVTEGFHIAGSKQVYNVIGASALSLTDIYYFGYNSGVCKESKELLDRLIELEPKLTIEEFKSYTFKDGTDYKASTLSENKISTDPLI